MRRYIYYVLLICNSDVGGAVKRVLLYDMEPGNTGCNTTCFGHYEFTASILLLEFLAAFSNDKYYPNIEIQTSANTIETTYMCIVNTAIHR